MRTFIALAAVTMTSVLAKTPAAVDPANTMFNSAIASPADWDKFTVKNAAAWTVSGGKRMAREKAAMAYFAAKTKAGSKGTAATEALKNYTIATKKYENADDAHKAAASPHYA